MFCPHCVVELKLSERQGIEVDYCPQCRGVWLDRGELDKIIERAADSLNASRAQHHPPPVYQERPRRYDDEYKRKKSKKKKYKSILEEIFDF